MTDLGPQTDDRHPAGVVTSMVDHVLDLAATWPRWDGSPVETPVEGEPARIYTPHKAIRRVADHLVDHLAEMEARLAGQPTEPDHWHASAITTPGDLAAFTSDDLDEARSRLRRLALIWDVRLRSLSDQQLDERAGDAIPLPACEQSDSPLASGASSRAKFRRPTHATIVAYLALFLAMAARRR